MEDTIKHAAKAVEDFADKVAAPQKPVVIVPDAPLAKPATPSSKG